MVFYFIISSIFLQFSSGIDFGFLILLAILVTLDSPVASVALCVTFWKQFLEHQVLFWWQYSIAFTHICRLNFLEMIKIHTFDIFSWLYRITCHFYLLTSNVKLTLPSISNGILISKFMIIS